MFCSFERTQRSELKGKADLGLLHFFEIQGFSGGQVLEKIIYLQAKDGILLYTKNYFFLIESGTTIIYIKDFR